MNNRFFFNIFLVVVCWLLYGTGILFLIMKLLVKKGLYVFSYHSFSTLENDYWKFGSLYASNYRDNFEKQVIFFDRHLKRVDTYDLQSLSLDKPRYFLAFDDGYKDNHAIALSVLKKYSVPAVFFIATGPIGTNDRLWYDEVRYSFELGDEKRGIKAIRAKKEMKRTLSKLKKSGAGAHTDSRDPDRDETKRPGPLMMDWDEVRLVHGEGIQIGAHTHTHPILAQLDTEEQRKEVSISAEKLARIIGHPPTFFAYPQGDWESFDLRTVELLKSTGFRYAFTTVPGINYDMRSPYRLKRIGIKASDPVPVVALKIIVATVLEKFR